ncbi:efflux RND transporter periplasmic adaptor subunit [Bacillus marasmi]|uniref:efflux RND transporter periplasmic adaptor subunit n=1 Tax=Bacillus marasmi TaxID=1926279 RepID=UPI0011C902B2|nr:efflux RND transporter periplasmic adaptor subunit [Bacillus marasmi]
MELEHKRNPKKIWIILGVLVSIMLLVGINIAVAQNRSKGSTDDLKFSKVTEREISNTKLVSGRVVPGSEETFYMDPTRGKLKEILVQEGQQVEPGQKLFSYDNPELSIQLKQFEIDKKMANLRYEQDRSQIASLKKDIETSKNDGADDAMLTQLEKQLAEVEFQLKTTELEQEKNKLQEQELQLKQQELFVTSSIKGIVKTVKKDSGQSNADLSGQGNPVIQIASQDPYQVHGVLTELQMAQIHPEMPIKITSKALQNQSWTGKITNISQYPTSDSSGLAASVSGQSSQNISYYDFKASLDSQDGLSPGYHVTIEVQLDTKKILAVPRKSIVEKQDSTYIFIVDGKKLRKQAVTTGMGDGDWLEILEGVKAGDKIVNNPSAKLKDGMEVKDND